MVRVEQSVAIDRPPNEVFAFVTDARNWPQLQPASGEGKQARRSSMRVGDAFRQPLRLPGQQEVELLCEVTRYEPDGRLSLRYSWEGLSLDLDFIFEPNGTGTVLRGRGEGRTKGFLALLEPLVEMEVNREVKAGLENFRDRLQPRPTGRA